MKIDISKIDQGRFVIREEYDEEYVAQLAVSLNEDGESVITGSVVDDSENTAGEVVLLTIPLVVVVLLIVGMIVYLVWRFV